MSIIKAIKVLLIIFNDRWRWMHDAQHTEDSGERCVKDLFINFCPPLPLINKGISVTHAILFSSGFNEFIDVS